MEYFVVVTVLGVSVLAGAVLPGPLQRLPLSLPMIVVAAGMVLFSLPVGLDGPRPGADDDIAERLTELVVIVSLTGAGLKLTRRVGWRSWMTTWRLLAITMPLTVAAIAMLGISVLGLPIAAAILLGAVIAPTDPVLASEVQLAGPKADASGGDNGACDATESTGESDRAPGDDDPIRFALTSEAGLNDGLAFPITNLAIAVAVGGNWFVGWVVDDVIVKLSIGLIVGYVLGRVIGRFTFRHNTALAFASSGEALVAFGITLTVYGIAELVHGYGFLAVFVAAVTLRQHEPEHPYHATLHDFAEALERIASLLFLLLLGGAAVDGALAALTVPGAIVAVAIVIVVRPLAGWVGLLGGPYPPSTKWTIAFFGIRGMGTIYYLAHAVNEEFFPAAREVWAVAVLTILTSIVVHGVTAGPVLHQLDRRRRRTTAGLADR
jgi:NhaP-type Na+/H+ or K+/H+ antiporter